MSVLKSVGKFFWDPNYAKDKTVEVVSIPIDEQIHRLYVRMKTKDVIIAKYDKEIKKNIKEKHQKTAMTILKKKKEEERQQIRLQRKHDELEALQFKQVGAHDTVAQVNIVQQTTKEISTTLANIDVEDITEVKVELDKHVNIMDEVDDMLSSVFETNDIDDVDLDAELKTYMNVESDEDLVFPEVSTRPIRNANLRSEKN